MRQDADNREAMPAQPLRTELAILAIVFVLVSLASAMTQKPARLLADGTEYHAMAAQYAAGDVHVSAREPFVYRLAVPWMAARVDPLVTRVLPDSLERVIEDANGLKGFPGFYAVNIVASLLCVVLLHRYVAIFVQRRWARLLVVGLWMLQWHAPVRFTYFYPAYTDPVFMAMLFGGLLAIEQSGRERLVKTAMVVSGLAVAGAFVRESILLVPLVFLARHWRAVVAPRTFVEVAAVLAPLLVSTAALAFVRTLATPTSEHGAMAASVAMLREKPVHIWVLAWFFTFGPATAAVIAAALADVRRLLGANPELGVFLALCGALAFAGGTDTERILGWAAPVVMVMLGVALQRTAAALSSAPVLAAVLILVAGASARVPWSIPAGVEAATPMHDLDLSWRSVFVLLDKTLVIQNYYSNLWSFFGSRAIHNVQLVVDVLFTAAVAVWIRRLQSARAFSVTASQGATQPAGWP